MYDYRCKDCENLGQCMSMMNMPMMNMPMANMPMANMPMMNIPMANMPMMNMPMDNMSMMNMPMSEGDDEDLKSLYPKIYIRIHPMVKHHYDMMVSTYGKMYCPGKDEMDHICKEICDKYLEHHKDKDKDKDNADCKDDDMKKMRSYNRRNGIQDLVKILLIGNLLGGRYNY